MLRPTSSPPRRACMMTIRTRSSAKRKTCNAPGQSIRPASCSVTSCSGLMVSVMPNMERLPFSLFSSLGLRYSRYSLERTRAMRPGMLNRSAATLQATMLVSSLRESASSKSASSAPARSNVKGDAPLPKTVWTSRRLPVSCNAFSSMSITVTSLLGMAARFCATVEPTCPLPKMRIFTVWVAE
ncbi:Uncharacterised protein [Neisseria meningitidis]|nr:Uncharacterised protein [Neisseria meningitidis]